jgi:hypothetical protein
VVKIASPSFACATVNGPALWAESEAVVRSAEAISDAAMGRAACARFMPPVRPNGPGGSLAERYRRVPYVLIMEWRAS